VDGVTCVGLPFEGIEDGGVDPIYGGGDGIDHVGALGKVGGDGCGEGAAGAVGAGDVYFGCGEVMGFTIVPEDV